MITKNINDITPEQVFESIKKNFTSLNTWDLMTLKACFTGDMRFEKIPNNLKKLFVDIYNGVVK
jgi:hypothetical protein